MHQETDLVPVPAQSESAALMSMMQAAVDKGIDVQSLERLAALYERMADRKAAQEFGDALAAFQAACPAILKSATAQIVTKSGARYSYRYAELDQIAETIRPHLHRLGFSYSWDSKIVADGMEVVCRLRHANGHQETATFSCPVDDRQSAMSRPQQHASTLTYAKRQALLQVLGLATTEQAPDMDGLAPGFITAEQLMDLRGMMDEIGVDEGRFLQYLGVPTLEELPERSYSGAIAALEAKRRKS